MIEVGARGPVPKPDGHQGHHGRVVVALQREAIEAPAAPAGWLVSTRRRWAAYWRSDVAAVASEVDLPTLERLFAYTDEWTRAMVVLRKHRLVEGSKGQPRMNPIAKHVEFLEGAISRLSTELGLTPLARARLGIAVGQARLTAAEVNRMAEEATDDETHHIDVDGWEPA